MANKKLDNTKQKELEQMVLEGVTPKDIADYFGVAVSSVHNYKNMLKEKGLDIPNVRGKRPSGLRCSPEMKVVTMTNPVERLRDKQGMFFFTVNGRELYVDESATKIVVEKDHVEVWF